MRDRPTGTAANRKVKMDDFHIEKKSFRQVLGHYPTGVCVVTARDSSGYMAGMTVGSFSSVSLTPPLVGFFPDKSSTTWPRIEKAGRFCVNVLAHDQEHLCRKFAVAAEDKFDQVGHKLSSGGQPVFDDVVAWIDCTLYSVQEAGDHMFVLGQVQALDLIRQTHPLIFLRGGYGRFATS